MADEECSTIEDLQKRQKQESKELQAKIQKLKHAVPKGDKKRKKEVNTEIEKLEADLKLKHDGELSSFKPDISKKDAHLQDITQKTEDLSVDGDDDITGMAKKGKKSKAQRRKEKKKDEELAKQDRIRVCEEESQSGARQVEAEALKSILNKRNLMIHEISSDGNCLYSAIVDQLARQGIHCSIESLRRQTAVLMRHNVDDYLPFLTNPQSGLPLTPEEYEKYCDDLELTPAWGGQVEIRALCTVLEHPIEVVQADGPCIQAGLEYDKQPIMLSYHRHIYGLGEHFNSVVPRIDREDEFVQVS